MASSEAAGTPLPRPALGWQIAPSAHWLVFGLTLVAWVLHLYQIDLRCLWWDESLSLHRAQHDLGYILRGTIAVGGLNTTDQHPPLYFALLRSITLLAGEHDLTLRFPAAAFATMAVPLLYALTARLSDRRTALVAALLAALSPLYLWYGQEARMYTMVTALVLVVLYALTRWLQSEADDHHRHTAWLALGVITSAAALATQYLFALTLAALVPILLLGRPTPRPGVTTSRPRPRRHNLVSLGGVLLLAAVVILLATEVRRLLPTLGNLRTRVPLAIMLRDALNSFALGLSVNLRQVWPLDVGFALVWLTGLVRAYRRPLSLVPAALSAGRSRLLSLWFLGGLTVMPVLLLWLFSMLIPIYTSSRYLIAASPVFYLGVALGITAIGTWRRPLGLVVLAAVVAAMALSAISYCGDPYYRVKEDYAGAVALIARDERPNDVIVVNGPENLTAFQHYYGGPGQVVALPDPIHPERLEGELTSLLASHDRVWLLRARTAVSDPEGSTAGWLDQHAMRVLNKGFPSCGNYVSVVAYVAAPVGRADTGQARLARFGDRLDLLAAGVAYRDAQSDAVDLDLGQLEPSAETGLPTVAVTAGALLAVRLDWLPLAQLDDYKVSLRLVTPGTVWAQRDREPFMLLPTSQWGIGRVISQVADLPLPADLPQGSFTLRLVLYRQADGAPLEVTEGPGAPAGHLDLATVSVRRQAARILLPSQPDAPARLLRPGARWGPLTLDGCDLFPLEMGAGERLTLRLSWRLRRATKARYRVVVTLRDAGGNVWHSAEYDPAGLTYDVADWPVDQPVRGILHLQLPPETAAGVHTVHLLVYDSGEAHFVPLRRGMLPSLGRDLELGTITVRRP